MSVALFPVKPKKPQVSQPGAPVLGAGLIVALWLCIAFALH
jgi:hypothetical protein